MMRVKKYYKSISPSTLMTHEGAKRAFIDWGHRRNYGRRTMRKFCSEMEGKKVSLREAKDRFVTTLLGGSAGFSYGN